MKGWSVVRSGERMIRRNGGENAPPWGSNWRPPGWCRHAVAIAPTTPRTLGAQNTPIHHLQRNCVGLTCPLSLLCRIDVSSLSLLCRIDGFLSFTALPYWRILSFTALPYWHCFACLTFGFFDVSFLLLFLNVREQSALSAHAALLGEKQPCVICVLYTHNIIFRSAAPGRASVSFARTRKLKLWWRWAGKKL